MPTRSTKDADPRGLRRDRCRMFARDWRQPTPVQQVNRASAGDLGPSPPVEGRLTCWYADADTLDDGCRHARRRMPARSTTDADTRGHGCRHARRRMPTRGGRAGPGSACSRATGDDLPALCSTGQPRFHRRTAAPFSCRGPVDLLNEGIEGPATRHDPRAGARAIRAGAHAIPSRSVTGCHGDEASRRGSLESTHGPRPSAP